MSLYCSAKYTIAAIVTEIIVTARLSGNIRQIIAAKSTEMYELTSGRAEIFTAKMSDDGLTGVYLAMAAAAMRQITK